MDYAAPFHLLIDDVRKRPAMYGVNNAVDLYLFMSGYVHALEGASQQDAIEFMHGFRAHVNKKVGSPIDRDWGNTIQFFSGSEGHSLELFGQLLEDYRSGS